jgi:uncharacterized protein YnzC (UPF0291/DUF896 family)
MAKSKKTTPLTPDERERQAILERAMARSDRELEDRVIRNQLAHEAREAEARRETG